MRNRSRHSVGGMTLLEVVIAMVFGAMLLIGLFGLRARTAQAVLAQKQTIAATNYLQDRLTQLRLQTWANLLSKSNMSTFVSTATRPDAEKLLPGLVETIEFSPWYLASAANADLTTVGGTNRLYTSSTNTLPNSTGFTITRAANGTVTIGGRNTDISTTPTTGAAGSLGVMVKVTIKWRSTGRERTRSMSFVTAEYALGRPKNS